MLDGLEAFKIPALRQSGLKVAAKPAILLFGRSGFKQALVDVAAKRDDVHLISVETVVNRLLREDA